MQSTLTGREGLLSGKGREDGVRGSVILEDPNIRLSRKAMAAALTAAGFPIKASTLACKATRGGGPPFQRFGPYPLYPWGPALAWAEAQLSPLVTSTSELNEIRRRKRRGERSAVSSLSAE